MFGSSFKATHTGTSDGKPQYRLGRYTITFDPAADPEDALRVEARRYGDKERGPDIEISDRQIIIDIDGLVDFILDRAAPGQIAEAMWANHEDVRRAFVERFFSTITESPWDDGDRDWDHLREDLLTKLGRDLLHRRLNNMSRVLQSAQHYERKYWELYHARRLVLTGDGDKRPDWLPPFRVSDHDGQTEVWVQDDPEYRIGSQDWLEARDWWRAKLIELWGLTPVLAEKEST